jgi:hypothetical protein
MGIFNFFIVIPQILAASILGFLVKTLFSGQPVYALVVGRVSMMIAGLLVLRVNESPAKWTGNGSRKVQPDANDWYETVKVNFGVRPDGSHDFPALPANFASKGYQQHAEFWAGKSVPSSWKKFSDVAAYWLAKGVDGFRYDMAEMVPVEFWSYLNSSIKMINPDAFLLAVPRKPNRAWSCLRPSVHHQRCFILVRMLAKQRRTMPDSAIRAEQAFLITRVCQLINVG